jgi:hypothetical protein
LTFDRPDLLWLGLVGIPLVILHFVRRRRKRTRVPSLILWEKVVGPAPRRIALRVLAAVFSLLLLLAAAGAAALSAAGPKTGVPAPPPKPLVIAIDASARMEGERFRRAVEIAREEIRRKAPVDPVTILLESEAPRILVARQPDGDRALAALSTVRPTLVGGGSMLAGPALSDALANGRAVAIGVRPMAPEGVVVHPVGGKNVGITGFEVRPAGDELEIWLETAGATAGVEVVVTREGEEVRRMPAKAEMLFTVPRGEGGRLSVALDPPSGPSFDDRVDAFVPARKRLRLGLFSEPDPFLDAALRVVAPMLDPEGSVRGPVDRIATLAGELDVIVIAGSTVPADLPPGNYLLLTPPPEPLGFAPLSVVPSAPIWQMAVDHPVTRGVDAAEVQVMGAVPARLPEGAEALLSLPGGAVAAAGEKDGARYVWIGIGPGDSTLPVTAAYPLLVRNALRWFGSLEIAPFPPAVTASVPLTPLVRLPPGLRAVTVVAPGIRTVVTVADGTFTWTPTATTEGEVRIRVSDEEHRAMLNILLPEESAVAPWPGEPAYGPDRSTLTSTERQLWEIFAAAAAIFLLLEWVIG